MPTLTVYPSSDGAVGINPAVATFALAHDTDPGTILATATDGYIMVRADNSSTWYLYRLFQNFDTSSLGASATIVSCVSYLRGGSEKGGTNARNYNVYGSTAADTIALASYQSGGAIAYCDTAITQSGWSTTGYMSWAWNATGLAAISKTGKTKICYREATYDVANTPPGVETNYVAARQSSYEGTSSDPYLLISYTTGIPVSRRIINIS